MQKWIYLIRHGETDLNRQGIVQGSGMDAPLNALGREQGLAFYEKYKAVPFEAVITSNLQRTHQTVAPFLEEGLPWHRTADINEISWGIFEGKPRSRELKEAYEWLMTEWTSGNWDARMVNGESANELAVRAGRFWKEIQVRPESHLLVCSHGRTMRCLMCLATGKPLSEMENFQHANTGLYLLYWNGRSFDLHLNNDTSHYDLMKTAEKFVQ